MLFVSFTYSVSQFPDDSDEENQQISKPQPPPDETDQNGNQLSGKYGGGVTNSQRQFQQEMLQSHNTYRSRHCVPPLRLDDNLSQLAQVYAERMARANSLIQGDTTDVGQNSFMKYTSSYLDHVNGEEPTNSWYNGNRYYNFRRGGFSTETGSFTQVVWKNSKTLGAGIAFTENGRSAYIVALYTPPGNFGNDYQNNVFPDQC